MHSPSRSTLRASALALAAAAALALPSRAPAQQWMDGSASMVPHWCSLPLIDPMYEQLVWSWTGFTSPAVVGQVYWMHIVVGGLGCSGIYAVPEVRLPPHTTFAVDAAHPITCVHTYKGVSTTFVGGECPVAPGASLYPYLPGFANLGHADGYIYGLGAGATIEIRFPVVTSQPIAGIADGSYLLGAVNVKDLNTDSVFWDGADSRMGSGLPNQGPWQGVFVFPAGAAPRPSIRYVEPTLVSVTATNAVTAAQIDAAGCNAQVAYEIYPADDSPDTTVFDPAHNACTWNASGPFSCALGWGGLVGGKTYRWRVSDWMPAPGQPANCARANVVGLPAVGDQSTGWRYFTAPNPAAPVLHSLVATGLHGAVAMSPAGGAYAAGTVVTVTATPDAGYVLSGWRLDGAAAGSANPLSVTMGGAHTVEALFTPVRHVLSRWMVPIRGGRIELSPDQPDYAPGEVVVATAVPSLDNVFTGWLLDGVDMGLASSLRVTMDRDHVLQASFARPPPGLQVSVQLTGEGEGTVVLDPPGGFYEAGTSVTATATPGAGSSFQAWFLDGEEVSGETRFRFEVWAPLTLSAMFGPPRAPDRTLTASASGAGTVAAVPPGPTYAYGTPVTLTATPAAGQRFAGWWINGAPWPDASNPLLLSANADMAVVATFQAEPSVPIRIVSAATSGVGALGLSPAGGRYPDGTVVTFTATPGAGHRFAGWTIGGSLWPDGSNPLVLTVRGDLAVVANFQEEQVVPDRTVTVIAIGNGSVALSPEGGRYPDGTVVTLTATPGAGHRFAGWAINGSDWPDGSNPLVLTVRADLGVDAVFEPIPPDGGGGGGGAAAPGGSGGCGQGGAGVAGLLGLALALSGRRRRPSGAAR